MSADEKPGPSSGVTVTEEELAQAEKDFKEAVKLVYDEPERAAMLLGKVLEIRNKRYGDSALECAETYLEYGRALFEQARSSTDVLGAQMRTAVDKHEMERDSKEENEDPNKPSTAPRAPTVGGSTTTGTRSAAEGATEDSDGGQGVEEDSEGEEEEDDSEEEEEEGDKEGGGSDDMALAWDMLEYARTIYNENGGSGAHASALADVHLLLGEVSTEQENFDSAVEEYDKCRTLLEKLPKDKTLRRLAEVHFKAVTPLQLSDRLQEALEQCRAAMGLLGSRKEEVLRVMDTPVEGETGDEAEAELEKLEGELDELEGIIGDLKEKEEELKAAIKDHQSMKQALRSAMQKLAEVEGGPKPVALNPLAPTNVLAPSNAANVQGGAPGGSSGGIATGAAPTSAGPVQDLGVAGRGRARITLQPMNGPNPAASAPGVQQSDGKAGAAQQAPKRRLEDIMGGGATAGGVTVIGFGAAGGAGVTAVGLGAPAAAGAGAGGLDVGKLDALMAKRLKTGDGAAAPSAPAPGAENSN